MQMQMQIVKQIHIKANQHKGKMEMTLSHIQDMPSCEGNSKQEAREDYVVVAVSLSWPYGEDNTVPYTPPPEDYEKVVEASLGVPVAKLGVLAKMEVERIYFEGLCGGARGHTKKATPFKNWVAYVVKCLWTAYNNGLLRGCRQPKTVVVKE